MDNSHLEQFKKMLLDEKNKILAELAKFTFKNKEGDFEVKSPTFSEELDMDTEADETEEFSALLSLEKTLEEKLLDIDEAIDRINKGEFGVCEKCGKEIETEKLEANPATTRCVECKNK